MGICHVDTAPQAVECTFVGKHERFQYTKAGAFNVPILGNKLSLCFHSSRRLPAAFPVWCQFLQTNSDISVVMFTLLHWMYCTFVIPAVVTAITIAHTRSVRSFVFSSGRH